MLFAIQYLAYSLMKKQRILTLRHSWHGRLFIRTHTADLDVFLQHMIYQELAAPVATPLDKISAIVDAGANIGLATLFLARKFPQAAICAIEADANNAAIFRMNCGRLLESGRVKLCETIFYPESKPLRLLQKSSGWDSHVIAEESDQGQLVPVLGWEQLIGDFGFPDLIKMDIEGSEIPFLNAAKFTEQVFPKCVFYVELHGPKAHLAYFSSIKPFFDTLSIRTVGEFWVSEPNFT